MAHEGRLSKIFGCVVPCTHERVPVWAIDRRNDDDIGKVIDPADYRVFLVNESDQDIAMVRMYTGGFNGTDEFIELDRWTKELGALKRGEALCIEDLTYGMLDFVLWYHLNLVFSDGVRLKAWFDIKGYWLRPDNLRYVEALKDRGHCFTLKELEHA